MKLITIDSLDIHISFEEESIWILKNNMKRIELKINDKVINECKND